MTIPRVRALGKYWQENPPIHIALSALLNAGKTTPQRPSRALNESLTQRFGKP